MPGSGIVDDIRSETNGTIVPGSRGNWEEAEAGLCTRFLPLKASVGG